MKEISICITTWNRDDLTVRSFEKVLNDDRINEVIIVDDNSDFGFFKSLSLKLDRLNNRKIRLFRNEDNLDCYGNKLQAVKYCTNDWCILFDSDNILDVDYIDKLYSYGEDNWDPFTIYAPEKGKPELDYSSFGGLYIDSSNVGPLTKKKYFDMLINTCNYFVNYSSYLRVRALSPIINPHAADTAFFNKEWIRQGGKIHVMPGLEYTHTIHDESHYMANNHKSQALFNSIITELQLMHK